MASSSFGRYMKLFSMFASLVVGMLLLPATIPAQLVREDSAAPQQPVSSPQSAVVPSTAAPAEKLLLSQEFALRGDTHWTDTGIDIQPGQRVVISASGTLKYVDAQAPNGPEGLPRSYRDLLRILPFNASGRGALIARIGDADIAQPFLIGAKWDGIAPVSGKLALGINQPSEDSADGAYTVHVEVYAADSSSTSSKRELAKQVSNLKGFDKSLFSKIPRRVADKDGNPGDMVNFLILGSEDSMQKAFTTAGWVKVDSTVESSILHGILGSLSKEAYLTMPMSQLFLFGRSQDYGWAHAEPISVITSRNHLRLWKAPFTVDGQTLWVGAATHDVGLERDQRNNGVTHKIDPDIDLERNYVEKSLASTGLVAEVSHFLPSNPMKEARTATGGSFHSNGEVLILKLAGPPPNLSPGNAEQH